MQVHDPAVNRRTGYALFDEHQTLDRIGSSLARSFASAAEKNMAASAQSLDSYALAQFEYVREVDVHSHWIGLAMLLILMGLVYDRVNFGDRAKLILAA